MVNLFKFFPGNTPQVLATVTATLTALSDGMQYGWSAPIIPRLQEPSSPVQITDDQIVWLENLYLLGGLVGIPITMYLVDKLGRKNTILFAAVLYLIAWLLLTFDLTIEVIFVVRFITGIASNTNYVTTPVYIAEISSKKIRGRLGSLIYIMMLMGILLIYSIGPFVPIWTSSSVGAGIIIVQLLTFTFMPDSPYYLLVKNKKQEAKKALQILRSTKDVDDELNEISAVVEEENKKRGRPLELFTVKSNRKALTIMAVLSFAQHYSSISVMLMNIHMILADAAAIIPPSTNAILFSALMLAAATFSALLIDKVGRKVLLFSSSFLTGFCLLVLASYFAIKNSNVDVSEYNWVPAIAVMSYAVTFKCGLGLIPIVMTAELFPTNIKAFGCTIADSIFVTAGATSIYLFHFLHRHFGMHVPFFLFGCSCLLVGIFAIFVIPETKGKTLDEIQKLLKGETLKPSCSEEAKRSDEKIPLLKSNGEIHKSIDTKSNEYQSLSV